MNTHKNLSFDGCGINGRDEYRSRIATFADKGGPIATEYGPLFAAAPDLLAALVEANRCLAWHESRHGVAMDRVAVERATAAIAKAKGAAS